MEIVEWKGMCRGPFRSEGGVYITTVRQDFPNAPRYIDPAVNSSSSKPDLLATRLRT